MMPRRLASILVLAHYIVLCKFVMKFFRAGHGPDMEAFEKASNAELGPVRYPYTNLSFMFETTFMLKLCTHILDESLVKLDNDYYKCWE